jgi:hypothetical protein
MRALVRFTAWERISFWRRFVGVVVRIGIVVTSFVILAVVSLIVVVWILSPPSLRELEARFPNQRHDLETIISMSDNDPQLTVIDPAWLATRDRRYIGYSADTGITQERWEEYRRLFSRNSLTQGVRRNPDTKDAFIIVKSFGLLDRGTSAGFLYCGPGPNHSYPPCSSSQPFGDHPYKPGDEGYSFFKLADRWYAFSDGPG